MGKGAVAGGGWCVLHRNLRQVPGRPSSCSSRSLAASVHGAASSHLHHPHQLRQPHPLVHAWQHPAGASSVLAGTALLSPIQAATNLSTPPQTSALSLSGTPLVVLEAGMC